MDASINVIIVNKLQVTLEKRMQSNYGMNSMIDLVGDILLGGLGRKNPLARVLLAYPIHGHL
jgi:ABC-type transport system involved in cytochrome bd biosynthesis fused ATPase/permease subunit